MNWESISANGVTAKCLIFKYTSSSYNSITTKINESIEKWKEDLNRHLSKEDIQ